MHENVIVIEGWYPLGGRGYTTAMLGNETIGRITKAHGKSPDQMTETRNTIGIKNNDKIDSYENEHEFPLCFIAVPLHYKTE
ncbi:hypothetical protein F070042J6_46280 [Bacteroides sp. f07]|uniref:hypothetical protein n=1 Tax=Bacteroides sp. f07 TaxID=3132704 RepID=UPI0034AEBBED